ncbi:MAG TPA: hypothetical protein VES66_07640 [Terriglobales bacterium]|nr:hypothetical protein [Terriglobales bacterium]
MKAWVIAILLASTLSFAQTTKPQKTAAAAEDYSGMYSFLQEGEFVQINVEEGNRLTGFISRYSDSEKANFVDHFFDKAELHDHDIRFSTRKVHGVWFEFKGTVSRGPGKTRNADAYYVIKGTLTQYTSDANQVVTAKEREVTFRSFPQDIEDDAAAKAGGARR